MIDLHFSIRNPRSREWRNIRSWYGSTPIEHKFWEVEIIKSADLIAFTFSLTYRQDHAGIRLGTTLVGYEVQATVYDNRHWDDETSRFTRPNTL
jgi:hypothetical protein